VSGRIRDRALILIGYRLMAAIASNQWQLTTTNRERTEKERGIGGDGIGER
jgi:hypothetical protein